MLTLIYSRGLTFIEGRLYFQPYECSLIFSIHTILLYVNSKEGLQFIFSSTSFIEAEHLELLKGTEVKDTSVIPQWTFHGSQGVNSVHVNN